MKKLIGLCTVDLIRPTIYKLFRRLIYAATAVLLFHYFFGGKVVNARQNGFALAAMLFVLGGFFAYLRLNGTNVPRLKLPRYKGRKRNAPPFDPISEHIDDVPKYTDDDLDEDENDASLVIANFLAAVLSGVASFF